MGSDAGWSNRCLNNILKYLTEHRKRLRRDKHLQNYGGAKATEETEIGSIQRQFSATPDPTFHTHCQKKKLLRDESSACRPCSCNVGSGSCRMEQDLGHIQDVLSKKQTLLHLCIQMFVVGHW